MTRRDQQLVGGPRLTFLGAAGTVTGSCYQLDVPDARLLVDCGLFQGSKTLKALNYGAFPFAPSSLSAVLLTHAHIDHSGLIPKLFRNGYRGKVFATAATRDLLSCMLPDCGHIQEYEVEQLNRRRHQRGEDPVAPIYTREEAERCLSRVMTVEYGTWIVPGKGVRARFWNAGHMLGSASIELEIERTGEPLRLLFSGDLGNGAKALHDAPTAPRGVDYLIVESTYGDRTRPPVDAAQRLARLAEEVTLALRRGGNLIVPVFAVERAQELLFDLGQLLAAGRLPACQIFVDSPLAIQSTQVFQKHRRELGQAADHEHPFSPSSVHFAGSVEESKHLNRIRSGAIILSASGMCDAGRVRHHLKNNLWRADATVLLVGYQAAGTLGRFLLDGARRVQIMGEEIDVKAAIRMLDVYSAHPDRNGLADWIAERTPVRRAIVLTHGEHTAIDSLAHLLSDRLSDCPAILRPSLGSGLALEATAPALEVGEPRLPDADAGYADWHNAYAALRLDLADVLKHAADDRARTALIGQIDRLLKGRRTPKT